MHNLRKSIERSKELPISISVEPLQENFQSFGQKFTKPVKTKDRSLMVDQLSRIQTEVDEQEPAQFQKLLEICQKLRQENILLKRQVQQYALQYKYAPLSNQNTSLNSQKRDSKQNLHLEGNVHQPSQKQKVKEVSSYKRQIYEEYKKKMKEMRAAVDYLTACYVEYLDIASPSMAKILDIVADSSHKGNQNKLNRVIKLYREHCCKATNKQAQFYGFQHKQEHALREALNQMKSLIQYLTGQYRETIKKLQAEVSSHNEKVLDELKKCIKKYFNPKSSTQNSVAKNTKEIEALSKNWQPPLPHHIKISGKTVSATPKNLITPKNERSFSNIGSMSKKKTEMKKKNSSFIS